MPKGGGAIAHNALLTRRCGGLLPQCAAGQARYSERSVVSVVI